MKRKPSELIHLVAAARPNFMKIAPLWRELQKRTWAETKIIHSGQHYDANMSGDFFKEFGLPSPHANLGVGAGSHAEQTGRTLMAYERQLEKDRPDLVVVVGDVNATLAAALAASKLHIKVAHLEAGLRSFDRGMPEEINRILTDALADLLWTPSSDGDLNLINEGVSGRVEMVGNIMIDALEMMRPQIENAAHHARLGLEPKGYGLVTLHRPANVDTKDSLEQISGALVKTAQCLPLAFPVHPRTRKMLQKFGLLPMLENNEAIRLLEPLSYLPFMSLLFNARLCVTDSGGIQEETTYLGIPCFTLRPNTERPVTIEQGTNKLCKPEEVEALACGALAGSEPINSPPPLWDGKTASRVADSIKRFLSAGG